MITLIGGSAILAVILFLIVRGYAAQIAQNGQDSILSASVSSLLDAAVIQDGAVEVDFPYSSFSMLDTELDDRVFYAIYQDGEVLSGYEDLPAPIAKAGEQSTFQTVQYANTKIRLASANRTLIGATGRTQISVSIAQTQDALSRTLNGISQTVALFGAGFFGLIVLLSYWATSITINPLMRLATSVQKRGPQDLSPFQKQVPYEMVPLVTSLNTLMGRLDHSLTQSEDFIAEAAHRLRTPLAIVRTKAEIVARVATDDTTTKAAQEMIHAIDESSRIAGQLLDHAMVTFRLDNLAREEIDLATLATGAADRVRPLTDLKDIELLATVGPPVSIKGDVVLIQSALHNLLDNAIKYAPAEARVEIALTETDGRAILTVTDTGSGFPMAELELLADRYARGSNATHVVGSGLGLTIVQEVMAAHGGTMDITNTKTGGACVRLSFPLS